MIRATVHATCDCTRTQYVLLQKIIMSVLFFCQRGVYLSLFRSSGGRCVGHSLRVYAVDQSKEADGQRHSQNRSISAYSWRRPLQHGCRTSYRWAKINDLFRTAFIFSSQEKCQNVEPGTGTDDSDVDSYMQIQKK